MWKTAPILATTLFIKTFKAIIGKSYQTRGLDSVFSTFTVNVPQLDADIDRIKAKQEGVPLQNLFETMQIYLGSLYVNDFNRFGRTYQVVAQADAQFRDRPEDITRLKTRNDKGQMVPLGAVVKVTETHGPNRALRYNGYPAAEINGGPAAGFSSGQAEALIAKLTGEGLPKGMTFEWTDLTYQRILAGNSAVYVYPLCILLVFLVLAAQYESLRLPLAIILIVPMCLLFAISGVWLKGSDNNIFTQIGLIVLVGLACKNAILIVEFARHKQDEEGLPAFQAAIQASRLRLRPILMTSIAFIAGVFPLVMAHGAGAEMRQAMGVAVFAGMIGVTLFGLFLTPVFYLTLMRRASQQPSVASAPEPKGPALGAAGAVAAILLLISLVSPLSARAGKIDHRSGLQAADELTSRELQGNGAWTLEGRPSSGLCAERELVGDFWRHQFERFGSTGVARQPEPQGCGRASGPGPRHRARGPERFVAGPEPRSKLHPPALFAKPIAQLRRFDGQRLADAAGPQLRD